MSDSEVIRQPERTALVDLRSQAMAAMSVDDIKAGLAEYQERRNTFRAWLLSQMEEGVHYGFPPGCSAQDKGKAWKAKPSLYKAGAEAVIDILDVRAEYHSDETTWRMMGQPTDTFFRVCTLYSKANGQVVGHGTGARKNGAKSMDVNASLKMADKSALVSAVISTYRLSDLFTQDIEDLQPDPHFNPEPKADAPKAQPRAERVDKEELSKLLTRFKNLRVQWSEPGDLQALKAWIDGFLPEVARHDNPVGVGSWRKFDIEAAHRQLDKETKERG